MHALDVISIDTVQRDDHPIVCMIVLIEPGVQRQRKLHDADIGAAAGDDDLAKAVKLLLQQTLKIRCEERVRAVLADQLMDIWPQLFDDFILTAADDAVLRIGGELSGHRRM